MKSKHFKLNQQARGIANKAIERAITYVSPTSLIITIFVREAQHRFWGVAGALGLTVFSIF